MATLADALLATEAQRLSATGRTAALTSYERAFGAETAQVGLAGEETVTFTAQQASIPITVLSSAPYPVTVVVTLTSDKFTFPDGASHQLVLNRPTTSWRFTAHARTSGDRLPIDVTLHTENGRLLLAHTVLTVHSTAISFVGVALTIFAGAVLLAWWARTWAVSKQTSRILESIWIVTQTLLSTQPAASLISKCFQGSRQLPSLPNIRIA